MNDDGIPRLTLEQMHPRIRKLLRPTVEQLGYLGEFFQTVGHVPDALMPFLEYTRAIREPLSDKLNEVLALTVCTSLGAEYERIQHERLSKRLGFGLEWIAAAEGKSGSDASVLSQEETTARNLALAVIADSGKHSGDSIAEASAELGPERAMAAVLQITRFVTIALLCNALELKLPVQSVFDEAV
jgi:alkylhydroperoxidase family enzyme